MTESEDIGKLFENPVMPVSNITSQPVSMLRLMQFRQYLTDDNKNCQCPKKQEHKNCSKELIHVANLAQFERDREEILNQIDSIEEKIKAR